MRSPVLALLFFPAVFLAGCSGGNRVADVRREKPVIRYVSLDSLYKAVSKTETGFNEIVTKRKGILWEIEKLQKEIAAGGEEKGPLGDRLKRKKNELEKINGEIRSFKRKIYSRIESALKKIAGRGNIDFILNIGKGLLYSGKKYDITEDVMREIIRQEKRSAPVSR